MHLSIDKRDAEIITDYETIKTIILGELAPIW